jgi:transposase
LVTGDGRALPQRLAAEVQRHLRRLVLVLEMLAEVEAERDLALAEASGKEAVLLRLKGIGPESAAVPCAEILHRTFASRRGGLRRPGTEPVRQRRHLPASKELARRGQPPGPADDGRARLALGALPARE